MSKSNTNKPFLPIICGPTGVGKTALAIALAEQYGMEVVSADSRQVYRLMDVGTAKPTVEEQDSARHHLIDVAWPDEEFNVAHFSALAASAITEVVSRGVKPVLVGGTGLYIRALTEGLLEAPAADPRIRQRLHDEAEREGSAALHETLRDVDPDSAERLHPNDLVRIVRALEVFEKTGQTMSDLQKQHGFKEQPYRTLKLGLSMDRDELYRKIDARSSLMFSSGLVEETEHLLASGYARELKTMRTIGYRQAIAYLDGQLSRDEAVTALQTATRRYAKQQLTWFHQDKSIIWVDSCSDSDKIRTLIDDFYGSTKRSGYG